MESASATQPGSLGTLVIAGVGLLGASLGLAVKQQNLATKIIGVGRAGSPSLSIAQQRGAIDAGVTDLADVAAEADVIVLCTPVRQIAADFAKLRGRIKPTAVVTDVGSTKAAIMAAGTAALGEQFVGSHPMAGSEKRGPDAARADLYSNGLCMLCGSAQSPQGQKIDQLWRAVGMRTKWLSPADHDRCVAAISHLPHAAASCLVNDVGQTPEFLEAAAGGFFDTTRVASGDIDMWVDILLTNRDAIAEQLAKFGAEIETLKQSVIRGDESAIREHLTRAKQTRDAALTRRIKGLNAED